MKVFVVTNEVVKRLALPELSARAAEQEVGFPAGVTLPALEDLAERPARPWAHDRMNMIGHDDPGDQITAHALVKPQAPATSSAIAGCLNQQSPCPLSR